LIVVCNKICFPFKDFFGLESPLASPKENADDPANANAHVANDEAAVNVKTEDAAAYDDYDADVEVIGGNRGNFSQVKILT